MDKNEYNQKLEEIRKQIDLADYAQAAQIADQIDWRKVRNVNTLCMISEIYEAVGRFEDSKTLLIRAYRRSPVGRTVLYRLVECTIALKQFDEAIEYYTEYVQAAPHDNNKYILKYKIYRGRGSSINEQIEILSEYLEQEYNEKYAYEQAKLLQQADRMEECIAACDDLVLWFHSGKYVIKALELKRRYASLTPKQQEIYDHRFDEPEEEELGQEMKMVDDETQTLTDTILEDAKKAIAQEVALVADQKEREAATEKLAADTENAVRAVMNAQTDDDQEQGTVSAAEENASAEAVSDTVTEKETDAADDQTQEMIDAQVGDPAEMAAVGEEIIADEASAAAVETPAVEKTAQELQEDVARDMRQIVGNVGRLEYKNEDEEAADEIIEESKKDQEAVRGMQNKLRMPGLHMPDLQKKQEAGKLTIDDILLSMGERGAAVRQAASRSEAADMMGKNGGVLSAVDEALLGIGIKPVGMKETREEPEEAEKSLLSEEERERTGAQLAAAFIAEENDEPQSEEQRIADADAAPEEDIRLADGIHTDHENDVKMSEKKMEEIINAATRVLPVDEIAREYRSSAVTLENDDEEQEADTQDLLTEQKNAVAAETGSESAAEEEKTAACAEPAQEDDQSADKDQADENPAEQTDDELFRKIAQQRAAMDEKELGFAAELAQPSAEEIQRIHDERRTDAKAAAPAFEAQKAKQETKEITDTGAPLMRPETEELFEGFLEIGSLRMQIASAISQATNKGFDKTSRTGNVLIFGAHGSGKTTLATALAKAIAAGQGKKYVKMARIYATDLNRKDIAATIAKIAGGVLIIEEAGDLEDNVADQMTTAMEFRTDGLIVVLEDEQKYLHDLLMRHPRLTMKFTSEIIIPELTPQQLVNFAKIYADENDFALSQTAEESLTAIVGNKIEHGDDVSITTMKEMVDQAIGRASTFGRKLFGGKKRFDESGRIILKEKDFVN